MQVRDSFSRQPMPTTQRGDFRRTSPSDVPCLPPPAAAPREFTPPPLGGATAVACALSKAYACRQCGYESAVESVMRRHVMAHFQYRPYACPHCARWAAVKAYPVRQHMIARHPGLSATPAYLRDEASERRVTAGYRRADAVDHQTTTSSAAAAAAASAVLTESKVKREGTPSARVLVRTTGPAGHGASRARGQQGTGPFGELYFCFDVAFIRDF